MNKQNFFAAWRSVPSVRLFFWLDVLHEKSVHRFVNYSGLRKVWIDCYPFYIEKRFARSGSEGSGSASVEFHQENC